jgi:hypothetical protein
VRVTAAKLTAGPWRPVRISSVTRVVLTPGVYQLGRTTKKGRYFYGEGARIRALGITDRPPMGGGIFIPTDAAQPPATFWEALLGATIANAAAMKIQPGDQSGFRRELIYGGVAHGVVSVSYREFSNDFARPASRRSCATTLRKARRSVIAALGSRIRTLASQLRAACCNSSPLGPQRFPWKT